MSCPQIIRKIISGGQTGADRAALDFAIEHNIPHGGWCPKGRLAENGVIEKRYELQETSTKNYPQRTEKNVLDSCGTVIFTIIPKLTGGSKKTADLTKKHNQPWLHLHRGKYDNEEQLLAFMSKHNIQTLNVAGSRASKEPQVYEFVKRTLENAFFPSTRFLDRWTWRRLTNDSLTLLVCCDSQTHESRVCLTERN